jgi:flagella basal body P-ring formation protein FlgA
MRFRCGVFSGAWRSAAVGILTSTAGALTVQAADAELRWQSPESIRAAARGAVLDNHGGGSDAQIEAMAVDERLRLPACATPLQARVERVVQRGQGTVAVSCALPDAWRLFVPVRVTEQVAVLVTKRNLRTGEVLSAADVEVQKQAGTTLPYNYLSDPTQVVGLVVRRTQSAGTVLALGALEHPDVIERGALVELLAGSDAVTVKGAGVALEPGRLRQRIRVRSSSGRVVEGTVEAAGQVRVGF